MVPGFQAASAQAMGVGAAGGAVFGVATSHEGSNPVKNALFYGTMGTAVGMTVGSAIPHIKAQYKDTAQAMSFLWKAPTNWNGPGFDAWKAHVEQTASPAVRQRMFGMYEEKLTTPAINLARGPGRTKKQLISDIMGLSTRRQDRLMLGERQMGFVGDVPYSVRLAMVVADEETKIREQAMGPFTLDKRGRPLETAVLHEAMEPYKKWSSLVDELESRDTGFVERVLQRAQQYDSAGVRGLVGPEQFGVALRDAPQAIYGRDKVLKQLVRQGRGDIAEMLKETRGVELGMWKSRGRGSQATSILIQGQVHGEIQIPLLHGEGIYRTGPAGKNKYQVRKQVFVDDLMGSIESLSEGGSIKPLKALAGDVWAAKMVHQYMPKARAAGVEHEFVKWINDTLIRSRTWDVSPFRPDRKGLEPNRFMTMMRTSDAMVNLPSNPTLQKIMGMPTGEHELVNPIMGNFTDDRIHRVLKASNMMQLGSENAARNAVFNDAKLMARFSFAAWESPVNKPMRAMRDFGKPYNVITTGKARQHAWMPAATRMERKTLKGNEPLAAQFHGLFDEEIELLRDITAMAEDPMVKPLSPFFSDMAHEEQRAFVTKFMDKYGHSKNLRRDLRTLADVHEGIFAAAIHKDAMMESIKPVALSHLNEALLPDNIRAALRSGSKLTVDDLKGALIGHEISRSDFYGFDRNTRGIVDGTYKGKARGTMTIIDVAIDQNKFVLQTRERYPMAYAKIGTHAIKGEARTPIMAASATSFHQMLREMRTGAEFESLYRGQPVVPIPSRGARTVQAFAPFQSLRKIQGVTETTLGTLMTSYLPMMTKSGKKRALGLLRASGIAVSQRHGVFQATFKDVENPLAGKGKRIMQRQATAVKALARGIFRDPGAYFGSGARNIAERIGIRGEIGNITGNKAVAMINMTGITTTLQGWNTMESSIPKQSGVTMHELMFLKRHGLSNTYNELLQRRARFGDAGVTGKFFDIATRQAEAGKMSPKAMGKIMGAGRIFGAQDVKEIARRPETGINMRTLDKYSDNFVIDLTVAEEMTEKAARKIRQVMGDTSILVPGTATDLYSRPFLTETGKFIDPEQFMNPLRDMMDNFRTFLKTGDQLALTAAAGAKKEYLAELYGAMGSYISGRGSITPDSGPWTAGIVDYRSYVRKYTPQLGADMASRVVGVSPEKWHELRKQGAVVSKKGNVQFLMGITKRYPITSADPALFVMDPTLRGRAGRDAIAVDESHRFVKQMDWDGDTLYAHLVTNNASVDELMGAVVSKNHSYRRFLHVAKYLGGAEEEMAAMVKRRSQGLISESVVETFTKRVGKMKPISDAAMADIMSKYYTAEIGRYSNLSKGLAATVDAIGASTDERVMRFFLADMLQQMAIDFGRQAEKLGGAFDPGLLATNIDQAMKMAMEGHIDPANKMMREVFDSIGLLEDQQERMANMASMGMHRKQAEAMDKVFQKVTGEFFTGIDPERAKASFNMMRSALGKAPTVGAKESVEAAEEMFRAHLRALTGGAELDTGIPAIGKMRGVSRQAITEVNRWMKMAAEAKGSVGKVVAGVRRSPVARAAGGLALGAGVLAGAWGAATPPVALDTGATSQSRLQRKPDVGMVGATGEAPMPGSGGGHVASRKGARYVPRHEPTPMMHSRRFYYDQTNRVPNTTVYNAGDPLEGASRYAETESAMKSSLGPGGRSQVNVNYSPQARRMSQAEMDDRMRSDMLGE